ncbi:unnamed protein product [Mytilus edulis]|uniref:AIG1-type G domain-containing protein n=1 Tax=Mytilus edulis TaxID=6550 RepID=A0A8S3S7I1_MYTED|nr:unnamed protein product [Mytilus edulis]
MHVSISRLELRQCRSQTEIETKSLIRNDITIYVIDTPGLKNSSQFSKLNGDIEQAIEIHRKENVIYALVIQIGKYANEEREILQNILKKEELVRKKKIIIFTDRKILDTEETEDDKTLEGWIKRNSTLKSLIDTNELSYLAFENKRQSPDENDRQISDLISVICEEEDKLKKVCPVTRTFGKKFGEYGKEFYDDQSALKENVDGYDTT